MSNTYSWYWVTIRNNVANLGNPGIPGRSSLKIESLYDQR
jgi:hypothetical protein